MKAYCRLLLRLVFFCTGICSLQAMPQWDLVLTESEWVAPNIIRIPFTLTGTIITVRARADTIEGNFFFDTGANGLLLNYRYFGRRSGAPLTAGGGVTGKVQVLGSATVDTFLVENLLAANIRAEVIDFRHIEDSKKIDLVGLIGYDVFKDYEVLFDYEASLLVLVRTDAGGNAYEPLPRWEYKPIGEAPAKTGSHIASVYLEFGSKSGKWFALDSGAEQNLLSNVTGKNFLKTNFEIRRRVKLRGTGNQSLEVLSGLLKNARLDTFQFKPMATLLTNLSEINAAFKTNVDGVLGYEFLSQKIISINYRKRKVTFYVKERP